MSKVNKEYMFLIREIIMIDYEALEKKWRNLLFFENEFFIIIVPLIIFYNKNRLMELDTLKKVSFCKTLYLKSLVAHNLILRLTPLLV